MRIPREKPISIKRSPPTGSIADLLFGWLVESGITSNSVIYVKDEVTVGIGTGEQDRVGVAEIARDKAYRKLADRYCFETMAAPYNDLTDADEKRRSMAAWPPKKAGSSVPPWSAMHSSRSGTGWMWVSGRDHRCRPTRRIGQ